MAERASEPAGSTPHSSRPPGFAVGLLSLAAAATVVAIGFGGEALADPPSLPPTHEAGEAWIAPTEIERLSIPVTPEQQGIDPNTLPEVPVDAPTYIFVNMDGVNLVCSGGDSSTGNSSIIACQYGFSGPYPAYGGTDAQRQSVMDAVEADWAPFDMVVTNTRPASGPYTMCMTGPANQPFGQNVLGIAPLDCQDANPNNIVFAFHSAGQLSQGLGANTQATTISQEVAHAYGLEHVGSTSDIMNPYSAGGNPSFTDNCIVIQDNGMGIICGAQHQQFCNAGSQNSYQELMDMFGSANPDTQPPTVAVTYPSDGDVFAAGDDFVISCSASDDVEIDSVSLWVNGDNMGTKAAGPWEWDVINIPADAYDLYCVATDGYGNEAMSGVVSITVTEGGTTGGDTGGTTTSGGDGGDTGGETGGDGGADNGVDTGADEADGGGLPPGFGQNEEDGCACTSPHDATREQPAWLLLALLALPLARRRAVA